MGCSASGGIEGFVRLWVEMMGENIGVCWGCLENGCGAMCEECGGMGYPKVGEVLERQVKGC